jgi:hypothetical protein
MADKELHELDPAGPLDGTELVYLVQGGQSVRSTASDLAALVGAVGGSGAPIPVPFTGTGASQEVDLGGEPAAMMVFVGGLFNYPGVDYEVDGATMTITTNEAGAAGMALVWRAPTIASTLWRLGVTSHNGGALVSISELYLFTDTGGTDVAHLGTPTQSSQYDAFGPANFIDRNTSTFSSLQLSSPLPGWFQVEFAEPQAVIGFGLIGRVSELDNTPKDMALQYFEEGEWVTLIAPPSQTGWDTSMRSFYA